MSEEKIVIKNAFENNLKHINLEIPLNAFTCVTGCSGCGKSSLVFDTIYAESQRGFLEGMTGNLYGQKLLNKPKVDSIENLRPALNISQNYYNINPRSTIGTMTEISYYFRSLFAILNSNENITVPENVFSPNNPQSCCPNCMGLGVEMVVSEALLIPDREKRLIDGAILFFKGSTESKEVNYLKALCAYYNIDINKKVSELNSAELNTLLYSEEKIKYKLSYKEGKRKKQHYVFLQGAISAIKERLQQIDSASSVVYLKYMEEIPCHVCNGSKLTKGILAYTVNGLNYSELEIMELSALYSWVVSFNYSSIPNNKKTLVSQLLNSIKGRIESLIKLKLGYLCLNRSIPTLSGGERQRVRIANQLNCPLKGITYILDEPCKGLHYRDVHTLISTTRDLIDKGNTVIAIEHNKEYISSADNIIELGPVGGPNGGYIVDSRIGKTTYKYKLDFKPKTEFSSFFQLKNICFRNINHQNALLPLGGITCITGVSGSGKSSFVDVIAKCISRRMNVNCEQFIGASTIKKVVEVNQSPIGKNARSTVVSYLEIFDDIRCLFAQTAMAKRLKLTPTMFSMSVKGGRCECCQGTGFQKIELNYLPNTYILCPKCNGNRFKDNVLSVRYREKTIQEILEMPISDVIELFADNRRVFSVLDSMIKLGLGYLKLGQMSMNLSGGEAQRIKLAKALGSMSRGNNIYILDEPTSGLNDIDISRFETILKALQHNKETIIIVEHNIEFIARVSDYIIDFGKNGGNDGGTIVAQGDPRSVFSAKESSLYML